MLRKITAYIFILLANTVLLAHAVVPHHHHHEQVCIDNTCCQENAKDHEHNTPQDNHQHDGDNNSATCVLKQVVVLPSNLGRQENACYYGYDNHSYDFISIVFLTGNDEFIPVFRIFDSVNDLASSYPSFLNTSLGLRAPPIV